MTDDRKTGPSGVGTVDGSAAVEQETQWLVALSGLPGVGKSTVAGYVTERLDATRLRTDVVRKELFDDPEYTESETEAVYRELSDRAGECLAAGGSVVLDATFAETQYRTPVRELAESYGATFHLLRVVCEQSVAERRIAGRDDVSDADIPVYRRFREEFEPIESDHAVIDNSGSKAETRAQVDELL